MLILVIVTIVANSQTTSSSTESVLFQDDFSTTANGWADAGSKRVGGHYHNGAYRIYAKAVTGGTAEGSSPTSASSVYPSAPPKVSIQVEAQRLAGDQDTYYGIACRADAHNSDLDYVFLVGDGYAEIGKEDASGYHTLKAVETASLDADAKNSLDADCTGDDHRIECSCARRHRYSKVGGSARGQVDRRRIRLISNASYTDLPCADGNVREAKTSVTVDSASDRSSRHHHLR